METNNPPPASPKSKGLPLWTALIALLVLAVVGLVALGAFLYFARSDKARLQRQVAALETEQARAKLNEQKAAEDAKMALARSRQDELLAQARQATNTLEKLVQQLDRVVSEAATLKTSEPGRNVALHPDLVAQARRFYENTLPALSPRSEVITRLEGARRIEQQLLSAMGTTFQPQAEQAVTLQNSSVWAEQELRKVNDAQNLLSALLSESRVKVTSAKLTQASPNLETAIRDLVSAEATWRQRAILEQTSTAKTNEAAIIAQAEAQRIIAAAELQASNILAQINQAKTEQANKAAVQEAAGKLETTKSQVQVQTTLDEARRVELRKKASNPEVQAKLAPFITPGYWGMKSVGYDKQPHSLVALQSAGALDDNMAGLHKLVDIATNAKDKVRPRWKMPAYWPRNPAAMEKAKEAQQLLIELGPVLVEMKLLDP